MNETRSSSDVVIIGAGMAGLSAARELHRRNIQAVVLEARDRVGGRVHSHDYGSGTIDLGATWFWPNEHLVQSLLKEHGLRAFPQPGTGDALYVRRGGNVHRVPSTLFANESYRFAGGAQSLPMAMAAALPPGSVRLNTPAERILVEQDRVIVETGTGTISAHNAIIAMPPPLALESIIFVPSLPESFAQIARQTMVWMASMVKTVAIYSEPFWREQGLSGTALSETGPFREFHDHSPADSDLAAVFGFAPAEAVAANEQSAIADVFIQQLTTCFGPEASHPRDVFIANWHAERYTSPRHQDAPLTTATYGHPFFREGERDARILWASTETADAFAGHLEGAVRAGLHAAAAVDRVGG